MDIAELSLSTDGLDATPRLGVDNRPYIRALFGLALAHWELEEFTTAEGLFRRLLLRDPDDGSDARFCLRAVRDGLRRDDFERLEVAELRPTLTV